ncbi:MAG: flagellar hook-basal body complex protein FliE, partial [Bdellovibrionales bacterium]|nr:flagellar hook-basal body complex protein FliE [Bdellovibrionales bacterium]
MSIKGIDDSLKFGLQGLKPIQKPSAPAAQTQKGTAPESFGEMLTKSIKEVDALQVDADQKIEGLVLGKAVTPHDAMIALEKADIAFKLMNQIRSKIVRAYEEV